MRVSGKSEISSRDDMFGVMVEIHGRIASIEAYLEPTCARSTQWSSVTPSSRSFISRSITEYD